jgi:hypothetical protein
VSSDFEASQVQRVLAGRMPADQGLAERYRAQTRQLGNHECAHAKKVLDRFAIAG